MTNPTRQENFLLSRVYAKGWNAARSHSLGPAKAPANPYASDPEKSRWAEGYSGAQDYYRAGPKSIGKRGGAAKAE